MTKLEVIKDPVRMLTVEQAAKRLGVSRATVYALNDAGELPYNEYPRVRGRKINEADIDAFLARTRTQAKGGTA